MLSTLFKLYIQHYTECAYVLLMVCNCASARIKESTVPMLWHLIKYSCHYAAARVMYAPIYTQNALYRGVYHHVVDLCNLELSIARACVLNFTG